MKKIVLIFSYFIFHSTLFGQDAKEILKKSYEKCQSIKNGYYLMIDTIKPFGSEKVFTSSFSCHFKKLIDDSLFSSAFHYQQMYKKWRNDVIYTGNELVQINYEDSTGTITSKDKWAEYIKAIKHNFRFYSPLISKTSNPLPKDSDYIDSNHFFKFIAEEKLNNNVCYHIQVNQTPENDTSSTELELRREYNFWINKMDMIPIQYDFAIDLVMDHDTMYQYMKWVLKEYEINNLKDETPLQLSSIPKYINLSEYTPYVESVPLPIDTIAPDWKLVSMKNEKISLSNLKGQLVLVDFFHKGCYPCIKALPSLQALNEKYKDKGLKVVGIDPYDKNEKFFIDFLTKRGITYTILLEGKDVVSTYRVNGYPMMYLIDKNGKIVHSHLGYKEGDEKELEEIIKKHL